MFTKGVIIAIIFYKLLIPNLNWKGQIETSEETAIIIMMLLHLGLSIFSNLLFSWISIGCSTGINKKLSQVILAYPAAWMLPIATYFVIGPQKMSCCTKTDTNRYHLGFSKVFTIINIILTMVMYAVIISYSATFYIYQIIPYFVLPLFLSLLSNIIFLLSDSKCCCSCCCDAECRKHETYVIITNTVKLDIVKIED